MPTSVAVAVAASYAGAAAASIAGVAAGTFAYAAISVAASFVVTGVLNNALGVGRSSGGSDASSEFASQASGRDQVVRSSVANRTVVYGRAMVSGPLVFAASTGSENAKLHLVIPLAGHEIDAVESIYFNDIEVGSRDGSGNVTSGDYAGVAKIKVHLGAPGDAADADLVAAGVGWTAQHRLVGVAYLVVTLNWDQDKFPTGIPNVKAQIRGKKIYDPRTATTAWSDNFALCVRDYLTGTYGLECSTSELDQPSFIAAANIADESITLAGGGSEARYTCNGVVDLGDTPRSIMEGLLSSGAGFLVWSGGKYVLHAGAYTAPAVTLTADDLRDSIKVRPRIARRDLFNAVRGTYVDPDKYWQPSDFPPILNSAYATQDGGQTIWRDMALPFTTSDATAQRIAKITLERSRQGITVEFPAKLTAFKVATMDTVRLTLGQLGWSDKEFKVLEWKFSAEGGVDLVLQEETAASYAWNSGMQTLIDPAPDTALPNPANVQPPGTPTVSEALYQTTGSAGVKSRVTVSFTSVDPYAVSQRLSWRPVGGTWVTPPDQREASFVLDDMAPRTYEFRASTLNAFGVVSPWSAITTREVLGLAAVPAAVTGFSVIKSSGFALAEWALHADLDVRLGGRIVVRHSPLTSGATWEAGIIVQEFNGDAVSGQVPLMTGTYLAKARDSSGNWSTAAASFVATEGMVSGFTVSGSSVQHPSFSGEKTGVLLVDSAIQLSGAMMIDAAGMVDTLGVMDAIGGIVPEGTYEFSSYLDLFTVGTRRFQSTIAAVSFLTGSMVDEITTLVDDWSPVDGDTINSCDVTLYASTTNDNPAVSPTWSAWAPFFVADFTCRAAKFKVVLTSSNTQHNIRISSLKVDVLTPA